MIGRGLTSLEGMRAATALTMRQANLRLIQDRWNNSLDTYNMTLLLQTPLFHGSWIRCEPR